MNEIQKMLAVIGGVLVFATLLFWIWKKIKPGPQVDELMTRTKSWWVMASIFAIAALVLAGGAMAQNATSSSSGLALPENPNFFEKNDPNYRKATVVVNGEIITGTDIDQRVALLASRAESTGPQVDPEQLEQEAATTELAVQELGTAVEALRQALHAAEAARSDARDVAHAPARPAAESPTGTRAMALFTG